MYTPREIILKPKFALWTNDVNKSTVCCHWLLFACFQSETSLHFTSLHFTSSGIQNNIKTSYWTYSTNNDFSNTLYLEADQATPPRFTMHDSEQFTQAHLIALRYPQFDSLLWILVVSCQSLLLYHFKQSLFFVRFNEPFNSVRTSVRFIGPTSHAPESEHNRYTVS